MKKFISLLTAAVMIFGAGGVLNGVDRSDLMISTSANNERPTSGKCGDNVTWVLDEEGTLTIEGIGDMDRYGLSRLPSPFNNNERIKKIVIDDGITTISQYAFANCTNLVSVTIPTSVKIVDKYAFLSCANLKSVIIPNEKTELMNSCFEDCPNVALWAYVGSYAAVYASSHNLKFNALLGDNVLWELENGVLTVSGEGDIVSPYNNMLGNTSFLAEDYPFWGWGVSNSIKKIIIEDAVTSISYQNIVNCDNLGNRQIPCTP